MLFKASPPPLAVMPPHAAGDFFACLK
ncbi:hypothetical protein BGLA2_240009 [Burkholderia gladioli]|nr:hypothetical protein BGLA2_240009 [Burkholderia gladioli]